MEHFGASQRLSTGKQLSHSGMLNMATGASGSSNGFLYFVVGALVVGVIVLGVMFFNGERNDSPLENAAEAVDEAADEIGDAARKAN